MSAVSFAPTSSAPTRGERRPAALDAEGPRRARVWGIAAAIAIHVAVVVLLFRMESVRAPVAPPQPLAVNFIVLPTPPSPEVEPPRPKPVMKQPVPQPKRPVRAPEPLPLVQPPSPVVTESVIATEAPAPAPARDAPPPVAAPPPPPPALEPPKPAPLPVSEPRFDAAYLNNPAPQYPAVSRRLGEQGRVLLRVHVDPQGVPTAVMLRASSGHDRLDAVALETVRRWRFVPARRGEEPVSAWVLVPIVFNLRS